MYWILQLIKQALMVYWLYDVLCDRGYREYQRNRRQDPTHAINSMFKIFRSPLTGVEVELTQSWSQYSRQVLEVPCRAGY